jgi:hypothetical protein
VDYGKKTQPKSVEEKSLNGNWKRWQLAVIVVNVTQRHNKSGKILSCISFVWIRANPITVNNMSKMSNFSELQGSWTNCWNELHFVTLWHSNLCYQHTTFCHGSTLSNPWCSQVKEPFEIVDCYLQQ